MNWKNKQNTFIRKFIFFILLILLSFSNFYCYKESDDYMNVTEANQKILLAFMVKDSVCGTTHNLTGFLPGNSRKEEVSACLRAISIVDCVDWANADPTPLLCKSIHFKAR